MDTEAVRVDLFGVECNTGAVDANGCRWNVEEVRGWDSPDQRTSTFPLTGRHGSGGSPSLADGRALLIIGDMEGPTTAALWEAYNLLTSSMPGISGEGDVAVYEPVPKFVTARQSSGPRVSPPLGRGLNFTLEVLADYPQKRVLTPTTVPIAAGASATFTAGGNFAAEIEVTLATAGTVVLTLGGLTLSTGVLPAGSVLRSIDRTIVDDTGADAFSVISPGAQWPAVVKGTNTATQAGTASLTLTYYDTFA